MDVRPARHQARPVVLLELVEPRAVHDAPDDLAHVEGLTVQLWDDAVELAGIQCRLLRGDDVPRHRVRRGKVGDDLPHLPQGVLLGLREVVRHPALRRVDGRPPEVLGADLLAGRGLHQEGPRQEDGAVLVDDDGLVGHGGDIGAAGRAGAEDRGDLGDAPGRHVRLVEEDPAEVLPVREDLRLHGQERAARVHEVDAGQLVLLRDRLRPEVLLHRQREVRPALHGRVVRDEEALAPRHEPDAGHDAGARHAPVVHVPGRQLGELQEVRAWVDDAPDALAGELLGPRPVL
mmetsp:Transcript_7986/g.22467  ORF Transcript_7986/g.22467 Transcript_7986/m.22467 type:complete len:290 (+) Transcript_7986:671-1540(+)